MTKAWKSFPFVAKNVNSNNYNLSDHNIFILIIYLLSISTVNISIIYKNPLYQICPYLSVKENLILKIILWKQLLM